MRTRGTRELRATQLSLERGTVPVRVRRSARARYARVIVAPGRPVEVVLPRRAPEREVTEILAEKRDWIERQLNRLDAIERRERVLGLDRTGVVWLHGEPKPIDVRAASNTHQASVTARLKADRLLVTGSRADAGSLAEVEAAILRWYRREARQRIALHLTEQAEKIGVSPRKLTIRDPKTRWGSCSAKATLSFSWRLVLAPFEVLDYVIVHELCHLRELNHSRDFWALVEQARPSYRTQFDWLREHGDELLEYRPVVPHA